MSKSVLIVGTGLGGLATGLRLASRGYKVNFVEKAPRPGGRLNQIKRDGFTFDTGPSFFSMPFEFAELINDCGIGMPFEFVELDPLYTVQFSGSEEKFFLYKDIDKLSRQFYGIEPHFKQKFNKYLDYCGKLYHDTVKITINQNFNNLPHYITQLCRVNPIHIPLLFKTFWDQVAGNFDSVEARRIISLIAFFLGRTPFDTNAVYTLLSYIEFKHTGYYNVKGGMYSIVEGLVRELLKLNATFNYGVEITSFKGEHDKLGYLVDSHGNKWDADIFVINADAALFRGSVFKRPGYLPRKLERLKWTSGYLTIYLGLKTKLNQVEHHNYYLGSKDADFYNDVMNPADLLTRPYYYVNVLSKNNPGCAPAGHEALFFVCPVPNLMVKNDWSDGDIIANSLIADFSRRIKQDISNDIVTRIVFTPLEWQSQYNLFKGAGLGLSHDLMQIGAFRPRNNDEKFNNVFYVGASTVPGAGLPMAVISSRLTTSRVLNHVAGKQ